MVKKKKKKTKPLHAKFTFDISCKVFALKETKNKILKRVIDFISFHCSPTLIEALSNISIRFRASKQTFLYVRQAQYT